MTTCPRPTAPALLREIAEAPKAHGAECRCCVCVELRKRGDLGSEFCK